MCLKSESVYGNDRSGKQLDNNHDKWRNKSKWFRVRESDAVSGYISVQLGCCVKAVNCYVLKQTSTISRIQLIQIKGL